MLGTTEVWSAQSYKWFALTNDGDIYLNTIDGRTGVLTRQVPTNVDNTLACVGNGKLYAIAYQNIRSIDEATGTSTILVWSDRFTEATEICGSLTDLFGEAAANKSRYRGLYRLDQTTFNYIETVSWTESLNDPSVLGCTSDRLIYVYFDSEGDEYRRAGYTNGALISSNVPIAADGGTTNYYIVWRDYSSGASGGTSMYEKTTYSRTYNYPQPVPMDKYAPTGIDGCK